VFTPAPSEAWISADVAPYLAWWQGQTGLNPLLPVTYDMSWFAKAVAAGPQDCNLMVLSDLIASVGKLIANKAFGNINFLLQEIDLRRLSPEVLLAIARATFPVRVELSEWPAFVAKIRVELNSRGLDAAQLSRGL
jgi:hypothetical protein